MKPIERISMYLQFRNISPHSFERKIKLSNGYYAKQLRNKGSVGSDILIKIHEHYSELNMLWVLTGEGNMIDESRSISIAQAEEFTYKYEVENIKLQNLQEDVAQLNTALKDKEKIISLYEFMMNQPASSLMMNNPSPIVYNQKAPEIGGLFYNAFCNIYAYDDTGSQVQTKFLSPCVLFTLATLGQNLFCCT